MGRAACRGAVGRALPDRVGALWHSSSTVMGQNGKFRYHWKSPRFARKVVSLCGINGGGAWESNPPTALFARHAGFEVQEAHQVPVRPRVIRRPGFPFPGKESQESHLSRLSRLSRRRVDRSTRWTHILPESCTFRQTFPLPPRPASSRRSHGPSWLPPGYSGNGFPRKSRHPHEVLSRISRMRSLRAWKSSSWK